MLFIQMSSKGVVATAKSKGSEATLAAYLCAAHLNMMHVRHQQVNYQEEVGIIAPFRNQVALATNRMMHFVSGNPILSTDAELNKTGITVDTVERYQGSQRNLIVLSTTVAAQHQLNALCNMDREKKVDRKLNVALSRAREQIIILGDAEVLRHSPAYMQLLTIIKQQGGYLELDQDEQAWLDQLFLAVSQPLIPTDMVRQPEPAPVA